MGTSRKRESQDESHKWLVGLLVAAVLSIATAALATSILAIQDVRSLNREIGNLKAELDKIRKVSGWTIERPTTKERRLALRGTVGETLQECTPWLLVSPLGYDGSWPLPISIVSEREWEGVVYLGREGHPEDKGKYAVRLIFADPAANQHFDQYLKDHEVDRDYPSMTLPPGITEADWIVAERE